MKRTLLLLLAAFVVVGLTVSCGGGGDDDDEFNFNGNWAATFLITTSNVPGNDVGEQLVDVLNIVQNGNEVTVTPQSFVPFLVMHGTCDPRQSTFNATGIATGPLSGLRVDLNGAADDNDSMAGAWSMSTGNRVTAGTWTGNLASRAAAGVAGPGSLAGAARALF